MDRSNCFSAGLSEAMIETRTLPFWRTERSTAHLQWVRRCLLAISDQGLISGSNFLLSLLLARWLAPVEYGAYALAFSGFMLIAALHQALLIEPMIVFGASRYSTVQRLYLSRVLSLNGWFAAASALVLAASTFIAFSAGHRNTATAVAGMIGAVPCILLFWLIRGACYVRFRPDLAALGALIYALVVASGVVVCHLIGVLSPVIAILAMGLASLIVSCALWPKLRADMPHSPSSLLMQEVRKEHLEYGRWAVASGLSSWVGENVWYWIVGFSLGVADVGALRAMGNLILPLAHLVGALSRLALPHISEVLDKEGVATMRRIILRMVLISLAASSLYFLLMVIYHRPIVAILYRGNFLDSSYLVVWLVGAFVISAGANSFYIGLRAMQAPSAIFYATGAAAVVAVLAALVGGYFYGLTGIAASSAFSGLTSLIVSWRQFSSRARSISTAKAMEATQLV